MISLMERAMASSTTTARPAPEPSESEQEEETTSAASQRSLFIAPPLLSLSLPPITTTALTPPPPPPPPPPSSSSSELAQQLRILQHKHDLQTLEITRLERQLHILGDLQNVSVSSLREALQEACSVYAPDELQATVTKLQTQLAILSSQPPPPPQQSSINSFDTTKLQLRIAELEEAEEQQRAELEHVYKDLKEQSASWIRLKAQYERLQKQYKQQEQSRLEQEIEESMIKSRSLDDDNDNDDDDDFQREEQQLEHSEQLLRQELELATDFGGMLTAAPSSSSTFPAEEAARVEQLVETAQLGILQQQWAETEKSYKLKQAQLKARNFVLEERLEDVEQQLSSLYTAYYIASQDLEKEQEARLALETNLSAADEQVAQYLDKRSSTLEQQPRNNGNASNRSTSSASTPSSSTPFRPPLDDSLYESQRLILSQATGEASSSWSDNHQQEVYSPARSSMASSISSPRRPLHTSASFPSVRDEECALEGILLFRSHGLRRKLWKEKHTALYLSSSFFTLVLSNPTDRSNPKTYITANGTAELQMYEKQPYAFTLLVSPGEPFATVLYLAAKTERVFTEGMNALKIVSSHPNLESSTSRGLTLSERHNNHYELSSSTSTSDEIRHNQGNMSAEEQEAADLERAILLSTIGYSEDDEYDDDQAHYPHSSMRLCDDVV